jgi:hypothetical protein
VTCAGCKREFSADALAVDTGLCYDCEQRPRGLEKNAFFETTKGRLQEMFSNIARKLSKAGPLTATSIKQRVQKANRELKKERLS